MSNSIKLTLVDHIMPLGYDYMSAATIAHNLLKEFVASPYPYAEFDIGNTTVTIAKKPKTKRSKKNTVVYQLEQQQ